jgi:negative regulator of sigma E activity
MRRVSIAVAAVALVGCGSAFAQPTRDPLLFAAIAGPANVSYTGVVEVVRIGTHDAEADVYHVEHRAPNLTRRVYSAPAALAGDAVVSKGDVLFSVDPSHHEVVESRNDAVTDPRALDAEYTLLVRNYRVVRKGDESFDGRPTIDLALVNRYTGRTTVLVRIDAQRKIALDRQEFAPNGSLVDEKRFEMIQYSTQVPTADFSLPKAYPIVQSSAFGQPPELPERIVAQAGFAARAPSPLPGGFAPVEGDMVVMQGVRTVHLLYSDGIRTFSLFENAQASRLDAEHLQTQSVRVGDRNAEYTEDDTDSLLAWSDGTLHYTLVCEAGLVNLPHLATAITR